MRYRSEVDGLRALAVLPVILFHAGFQIFSGGFVGVDVFFVISGYLITTIILSEMDNKEFSIVNFYERRARRILPALFFMILVCLPFAWFWLFPRDLNEFSGSMVSVSTFISNFFFWKQSSYFDSASELKPLLHTWSLAVEEQYYLIFPVIIILFWRLGKNWLMALLTLAGIVSLVVAQWASSNTPTANYYLLPTRFWELWIGGLIAFYFNHSRNRTLVSRKWVCQVGSLIGFALIAYSIVHFDKETPFPSLYTLIPTVGAALIILFSTPETYIGRLLSMRLFVLIGLISYSAYLWHQPVFAFARHISVEEPNWIWMSVLAIVSLGLAYVSWKYVESPFRSKSTFNRKSIFTYSLVGLLLFIGIGLTLPYANEAFPLTAEQQKIYDYAAYDFNGKARRRVCFLDSSTQSPESFGAECKEAKAGHAEMLLWGDSHAAALSIGLRALHENLIQYTANSCPPLIGKKFVSVKHCEEINNFVLKEIARLKPRIIVMDSNWHAATKYGDFIPLLKKTIELVREKSPESEIIVVGTVPIWTGGLPTLLLKRDITLQDNIYISLPIYEDLKQQDQELEAAVEESGARFLSALDVLCVDGKCQATSSAEGSPALTAFDYGHLTAAGSIEVARRVIDASNLADKGKFVGSLRP
jgi:Predicted acyltransferases